MNPWTLFVKSFVEGFGFVLGIAGAVGVAVLVCAVLDWLYNKIKEKW